MVQVENEYGCFGCDYRYMAWMRNETHHYVGDKAVLFSNDVKTERTVRCGKVHDVLEGSNFEVGNYILIDQQLEISSRKQII